MNDQTFFSFLEELEDQSGIKVPLFLKYATECKIGTPEEGAILSKSTNVDFYSTSEKICHTFYKPISKIIKKQPETNG